MATDHYEEEIELDDEIVEDDELDINVLDDEVDFDEDADFVETDDAEDAEDEDLEDEDEDEEEEEDVPDDDLDDVVVDEDEEEEDEETLEVLLGPDSDATVSSSRSRDDTGDAPPGEGEFTCRSCFLVKRRAQLADATEMICLDCA